MSEPLVIPSEIERSKDTSLVTRISRLLEVDRTMLIIYRILLEILTMLAIQYITQCDVNFMTF